MLGETHAGVWGRHSKLRAGEEAGRLRVRRGRRRPGGPGGTLFGLAVAAALVVAGNALADEAIDVPPGLSRAEVRAYLGAAAPGSTIVFHGTYDWSTEPDESTDPTVKDANWLVIKKSLRIVSSKENPAIFLGMLGGDHRPFRPDPTTDPYASSAHRLFKFDGAGEVCVQGIHVKGFRTALYVVGNTKKVRVTEMMITNTVYGIFVSPTGSPKARISDNELLDVETGISVSGRDSTGPDVKIEGNRVQYLREGLFTSRAPSHVPEGIVVEDVPGARITGNWVSGFDQMLSFGLAWPGGPEMFLPAIGIEVLYTRGGTVQGPRVDDNDVESCALGILLEAQAPFNPTTAAITDGRLWKNRVVNCAHAVLLTSGANGYRIDDTELSGNTSSDLYLAGGVNAEQSFFFPPWFLTWTFVPLVPGAGILLPPLATGTHDIRATVKEGRVIDNGTNNTVLIDDEAGDDRDGDDDH